MEMQSSEFVQTPLLKENSHNLVLILFDWKKLKVTTFFKKMMAIWVEVPECPDCGDVMRPDSDADWQCTGCGLSAEPNELQRN